MTTIVVVADLLPGWDATEWVALLAVVGSLAGVWLGKALEARNQQKLQQLEARNQQKLQQLEARNSRQLQVDARKQEHRRALEDAVIKVERLYLKLDPYVFLSMVTQSALISDLRVADHISSLRAQADQTQDAIVQAGIGFGFDPSLLANLERSRKEAVEAFLLFAALTASELKRTGNATKTPEPQKVLERLRETRMQIDVFRRSLGLSPTHIPHFATAPPEQQGPHPHPEIIDRLRRHIDPKQRMELTERPFSPHEVWPRDPYGFGPGGPGPRAPSSSPGQHAPKAPSAREEEKSKGPQVSNTARKHSRLNLADLSPTDFEHLIAYLFDSMGLDVTAYRTNESNGVDIIATDPHPILGGKVLIQVERNSNPVDVRSVQALYARLLQEQASKGILVTTAMFSARSYNFVADKPIELIDGPVLKYLLSENAGLQTEITLPGLSARDKGK
jgi:Restriction endonuclease